MSYLAYSQHFYFSFEELQVGFPKNSRAGVTDRLNKMWLLACRVKRETCDLRAKLPLWSET